MSSSKTKKNKKTHSKKGKQLKKLINNSDSESECSEHELSYYLNDRVKLMKEVLKIMKPKKIKSMAPDCIKKLDNEEINSMLLEELLGISNKRLKYIFNGKNLEEDSSSTDPEEEQQQQPIDIISLDDISDDEFIIDLDSDATSENKGHKKHGNKKIKEEPKKKKLKKEKHDKFSKEKTSKKSKEVEKDKTGQENLMSVLELLELQARARAIKSQLALENSKKAQEKEKNTIKVNESDHDDAVIIESPKNIEIIITSSESETEDLGKNNSEYNINKDTEEPTDKEDNNCKGDNREGEENSNQAVLVNTDGNEETVHKNSSFDKDGTLENPAGEMEESEINNEDEIRNRSENINIESVDQPGLNNKEQNKPENRTEINTEEEDMNRSVKQSEKINMEAKSHTKQNNATKDTSTKDSINSEDIFVIDSESESDKIIDNSTRRKSKKCKKGKTKKSHDSDQESGNDKSITKNRRVVYMQEVPSIDGKPGVSGVSNSGKEIKIKIETKHTKQNKEKKVIRPIRCKNSNPDEGEGIVINMDPSEIDCIISD